MSYQMTSAEIEAKIAERNEWITTIRMLYPKFKDWRAVAKMMCMTPRMAEKLYHTPIREVKSIHAVSDFDGLSIRARNALRSLLVFSEEEAFECVNSGELRDAVKYLDNFGIRTYLEILRWLDSRDYPYAV